ncbi:MAG: cytochrome c biogenesis protein ResB [Propionibacteriaceae bacterium]|nr:cytochrome c biogenesis protein ResB [Propionibacteriaceae bacterium]
MNDQLKTDTDFVQESTPATEAGDYTEVSIGEFFRRIYQVTYSKTVGLIIILILTAYVLLGVLIPQASSGVWNDIQARENFLDAMQNRFRGLAALMNFLGLFNVFTSIGFMVVMGALTISILGCTTHRIPQLWQRYKHPRIQVSDRFFAAARYRGQVETAASDEQTIAVAKAKLKAARYRVLDGERNLVYADKFSWGGIGTVIAHLAFILIIAAYVITSLTGYEAVINIPAGGGKQIPVGAGTDYTLEATSFDASFDPETGRPTDYVSNLILRAGDQIVKEQQVRVNTPLNYGGFSFHQGSYGNALDITISSKNAEVFSGVVVQSWPGTWMGEAIVVGTVELPTLGLLVDVISPRSGVVHPALKAGQVMFVILQASDGAQLNQITVDHGQTGKIGDMSLTFDREGAYTGIMVRNDPGSIWMGIASILLVAGMMITFLCRPKRVWMRAQDGVLMIASPDKEDSGFRREFTELLSHAQTWFEPVRSKK